MNHIYRLVWSRSKGMLVAVAEIATAGGRGGLPGSSCQMRRRLKKLLQHLAQGALLLIPAAALALPQGGQVVAGQATITQPSTTQLAITQATQKAILDWQGFSIGQNESVDFLQPNASSVTLNRVIGQDPSVILGHLSANGQVFLINGSGITFGKNAQVNTSGLAASTLNLSNNDFLNGNYTFSGTSTAGITNAGQITAANGGYIAFISNHVTNTGSLTANGGNIDLGAGSAVTLTLAGNRLTSFQVSQSALNALIANGGAIQADGGAIILSAQAKDALLQTVVNNTGQIRAQTVENHNGTIELLGGDSGTVNVAGTLDASAPTTGNGGLIETSGEHVQIADSAVITTQAANGQVGTWLIDPNDFTIAASGGDITGTALSTALNTSDVTIQTTSTTASCTGATCGTGTSGNGDINVNDSVSWGGTAAHTLTLDAYRNININSTMNVSGTGGASGLTLEYGQGSTNGVIGGAAASYNVNAPVNLAANSLFKTQLGTSGALTPWKVLTTLGAVGSTTGTDLQGINGNLSGHFVLGQNIDASATSTWNGGAGFAPIGANSSNAFTGTFDGLNHTISNLTINRASTNLVGLFGANQGTIRNVGIIADKVSGASGVGGLVGMSMNGTISNAYATGSVSGTTGVGGLVGMSMNGTISNAYATGSVSGSQYVGGLVGASSSGTISNAYATGSVSGTTGVGGLAGMSMNGAISNAYATGNVSGTNGVGGLVGSIGSNSIISSAYATGSVSGTQGIGGLVGMNMNGAISDAYATGNVSGTNEVGGLVGMNGGAISNAYATGSVSGGTYVGGLVAVNASGAISNAYATGSVSGSQYVGGLVGVNSSGTISNGYWDTTTSGTTIGVGGSSNTGGATGETTANMMKVATFLGWDISSTNGSGHVWRIYEGNTLPLLETFLTPVTATLGSTTVTYNGIDQSAVNVVWSPTSPDMSHVQGSFATGGAKNVGTYVLSGAGVYSDQQGYDIVVTGNGSLTITPKALTVTGTTAVSRVYDGTTVATLNGATLSGVLTGDTVTLDNGTTGTFADQNVGNGIAVSSAMTLSGTSAGNYSLTQPTGLTADITSRVISLSGSRVYDGTTNAAAGDLSLSGLVSGEMLTLTGAGSLADKNVGTNKAVTLDSLALGNGTGGGLVSNYTLVGGTDTLTVDPFAVNLGGQRNYDGTIAIAGSDLSVLNPIGTDTVTVGGAGPLVGGNVGNEAIANFSSLTLNNSNYTLLGATGSVTITPKAVTLSGSRVYDGASDIAGSDLSISNVISGDTVTVSGTGVTALAGKNVGFEVITSTAGLSLSNPNYTTGALGSVDISPLAVILGGQRNYDGTTVIAGSHLSVLNLKGSDTATVGGTGTLVSGNVGSEAINDFTGLTLSNSNYTLASASGLVTIKPGRAINAVMVSTAAKSEQDGYSSTGTGGSLLLSPQGSFQQQQGSGRSTTVQVSMTGSVVGSSKPDSNADSVLHTGNGNSLSAQMPDENRNTCEPGMRANPFGSSSCQSSGKSDKR